MHNSAVAEWRFNSDDSRFTRFFNRAGFAMVENVLDESAVARLIQSVACAVGPSGYAKRNLLEIIPEVRSLAASKAIRALVEPVLGAAAFPVKGILFDKTPGANWKVAWHQDTMIAVRERIETPGFGPWSIKDGVHHVQPPAEALAGMMTVRVHLDDCGPDNGPLRVIPASHNDGLLSAEAIDVWRESLPAVTCTVARGGVLLMRPLTLHASSAADKPGHRRVIHLEYAGLPLPNGLHWAGC
jgi:ectoine hydroxylase-related dioxygenase (phytanoyl-CoA dioxygenase family)